MKTVFKNTLGLAIVAVAAQAAAEVTFYEQEGFQGQTFTAQQPINNLQGVGFNDRASSAVVAGDFAASTAAGDDCFCRFFGVLFFAMVSSVKHQ